MGGSINIDLLTKILSIVGSALMIVLGIARYCDIMKYHYMFPLEYIVATYLILQGVLFILIEIPIQMVAAHFNFVKNLYGKAGLCVYLGLFCFESNYWFTITVGVIWWVIALVFLIIALVGQFGGGSSAPAVKTTTKVSTPTKS